MGRALAKSKSSAPARRVCSHLQHSASGPLEPDAHLPSQMDLPDIEDETNADPITMDVKEEPVVDPSTSSMAPTALPLLSAACSFL